MKRGILSARELGKLDSLTLVGDFRRLVYGIVHELDESLAAWPYHVLVVYGARSFAEQAALYAKGRTAPGSIVTYAQPADSAHCYAAAADIAIVHDRDDPETTDVDETNTWVDGQNPIWERLAVLVRSAGLVTGADFRRLRDLAHLEIPNWRALVASGALEAVRS